MTLTDILEPTREADGAFVVRVPETWTQGRGAFGGLVLGSMVRCIELSEPDAERSLRSLTGEIAGPVVVGNARVVVTVLRRGSAVSTYRASLSQQGEILAEAIGVFGRARPVGLEWQHLPRPVVPPWREIEPAPVGPPIAPVFTQHMEYRVAGSLPFSGSKDPVASGWVRPRDPGPRRGNAYLTACIDAWWPACAALFDAPRPLATVTFTMHVVGTLDGLDLEAPLMYAARTPIAHEGYTVELRELWGEDGRLLALNQQSIAIIK